MLDSLFLLTFFYVCKTDLPSVNRNIQRYFNELSICQFLLDKFLDDTADTQTDFGKLDEQLPWMLFQSYGGSGDDL